MHKGPVLLRWLLMAWHQIGSRPSATTAFQTQVFNTQIPFEQHIIYKLEQLERLRSENTPTAP